MQAQKAGVLAQAGPCEFDNQGTQGVCWVVEAHRIIHEGGCDLVLVVGQRDTCEVGTAVFPDDCVRPIREHDRQGIDELLVDT